MKITTLGMQGEPGRDRRRQGELKRSQEEPGGARRSQEESGGAKRARRSQEESGGVRRSQEESCFFVPGQPWLGFGWWWVVANLVAYYCMTQISTLYSRPWNSLK